MSPRRSSRRTNRDASCFRFHVGLNGIVAACLVTIIAGGACSRSDTSPEPTRSDDSLVRVLACHIGFPPVFSTDSIPETLTKDDRPQGDILALIRSVRPDIVAVLHIENRARWDSMLLDLESLDISYSHREFKAAEGDWGGMGIASRLPIIERRPRLDLEYSIQGHPLRMSREIIDVTILAGPRDPLRLVLAHLKDKTFHKLGQTEMRRNEARLVARHIHSILEGAPGSRLLFAGALHDESGSAAVQKILGDSGAGLVDLRPTDPAGNGWTKRDLSGDLYTRSDYLLASPALASRVDAGFTGILDIPQSESMSMHRPVVVALRSEEPE